MNEEPNGNRNYNEVDGRRFSYTKNNNALFICLAAFQAAKWPAAATFTQIGLRLHYLFLLLMEVTRQMLAALWKKSCKAKFCVT